MTKKRTTDVTQHERTTKYGVSTIHQHQRRLQNISKKAKIGVISREELKQGMEITPGGKIAANTPVEALDGIGKNTAEMLKKHNIFTKADLDAAIAEKKINLSGKKDKSQNKSVKSKFRVNKNGELLMDITDEFAKYSSDHDLNYYTRYNGGWIKRIDGLDPSRTDGYSLKGKFMDEKSDWIKPGIYLDKSVSGSRKNHNVDYTLFRVEDNGEISIISHDYYRHGNSKMRDWAIKLWDDIERETGPIST